MGGAQDDDEPSPYPVPDPRVVACRHQHNGPVLQWFTNLPDLPVRDPRGHRVGRLVPWKRVLTHDAPPSKNTILLSTKRANMTIAVLLYVRWGVCTSRWDALVARACGVPSPLLGAGGAAKPQPAPAETQAEVRRGGLIKRWVNEIR